MPNRPKCLTAPRPRSFRATLASPAVRRAPAGSRCFSISFSVAQAAPGRRNENGSVCAVAKSQADDRAFTRNRTGYTSENALRLVRCRNLAP
jgi:hypothetical protein